MRIGLLRAQLLRYLGGVQSLLSQDGVELLDRDEHGLLVELLLEQGLCHRWSFRLHLGTHIRGGQLVICLLLLHSVVLGRCGLKGLGDDDGRARGTRHGSSHDTGLGHFPSDALHGVRVNAS